MQKWRRRGGTESRLNPKRCTLHPGSFRLIEGRDAGEQRDADSPVSAFQPSECTLSADGAHNLDLAPETEPRALPTQRATRERIFIEPMTSDRTLQVSREDSKCSSLEIPINVMNRGFRVQGLASSVQG